ncbi:MAG: hypothetical protein AAF628_27020 [Planctomycetota bacterium]
MTGETADRGSRRTPGWRVALLLAAMLGLAIVVLLRVVDRPPPGLETAAAAASDPPAAAPTAAVPAPETPPERAAVAPAEAAARQLAEPRTEPAPDATLGPRFALRVLDRAVLQHLTQLELWAIPRGYEKAAWRLPDRGSRFTELGTNLQSPLTVEPIFGDGDPTPVVSVRVGHAGAATPTDVELVKNALRARGLTLFVRAPGYAWGKVDVDPRVPGEREVLLPHGGSWHVRLANWQPEAYAALGHEPRLEVEAPDAEWDHRVLLKHQLDDDDARDGVRLDGLGVGEYEVRVALGHSWHVRERVELAQTTEVVVPGEQRDLTLTLADPPEPAPKSRLTGTLTVGAFDGRDQAVLKVFGAAYVQGRPTAEVPLADMTPEPGVPDTWRFAIDDLRAGPHQLKLWPLLCSEMVEVGDDQPAAVRFDAIATVDILAFDRRTNATAPLEELFWGRQTNPKGIVNHIGGTVEATAEPGRFRLYTTPGEIYARVDFRSKGFSGTGRWTVGPGRNDVQLTVGGKTGVRFVFTDGETKLPVAASGLPEIELEAVEGEGEGSVTLNATRTNGSLEVSEPGLYRATFTLAEGAPFLPVEPVETVIVLDEIRDVEVPLRRASGQ